VKETGKIEEKGQMGEEIEGSDLTKISSSELQATWKGLREIYMRKCLSNNRLEERRAGSERKGKFSKKIRNCIVENTGRYACLNNLW
jgi:hypothetical protein